MSSIISEIKTDLQHNFTTRSYTSFSTEYAVIRSSLGKNYEKSRIELEKIRIELEKCIKQYIIEELEYDKSFEITITIHKDYANDFTVNFLFIKK
jgi:hypothetical protein